MTDKYFDDLLTKILSLNVSNDGKKYDYSQKFKKIDKTNIPVPVPVCYR